MVKGLFVGIIAAVAFIVFSLVDCLFAERYRFRALNKPIWILIIIVLPVVGSILWFVLGRRGRLGSRSGGRQMAPDDDPEFTGRPQQNVSEEDRESMEEQLRRLEQQLSEHDDDGPAGKMK